MGRGDATPRNEQLLAIDRQERAVRDFVALSRREPLGGRSAAAWVVHVNGIRAARDGVVEAPGLQNVVSRQRVPADDAPRFANPHLRARCRDPRARETRHAPSKELQQLHRLQTRFDFGPRQVIGIERIDVDDARHVDGHLVGIRRDKKRDKFARNVDEPICARSFPEVVQTCNRR